MKNKKEDTPPPYDKNGKGIVGEGRGAPEAPIKDDEKDERTDTAKK